MPALAVADAHVDVLWRMLSEGVPFYGNTPLCAGAAKLRQGGVRTQVFALFVSPSWRGGAQLRAVLRSIDVFMREVVQAGSVAAVRWRHELSVAHRRGELAGLLSLEGAACLGGDPALLRVLFSLGVRGVGFTWNGANDLADGCLEERGAGLTTAGRAVLREMGRLGVWADLAHLADSGVRDVLRWAEGPVLASHANCRALWDHPRNLPDEVIRALIQRQGWLGLTFEASFLNHPARATLDHVLAHLDHVLDLGGEDCVGLGSDFDGVSHPLPGLVSAADY
ncbi:MAG: membrane dipeptidase, partial [Alicyclobacillus sp.]|nr:membrane dipeptidase [Alicyclobacillus sp.]